MSEEYDVIVVGAGNAAMCAALSAHEHGAKVVILERAPEEEAAAIRATPPAPCASLITVCKTS